MNAAYIASRTEYLLSLYCWWCGAIRRYLTITRPCGSCGAEFGETAQPEILIRHENGTVGFQRTLFADLA